MYEYLDKVLKQLVKQIYTAFKEQRALPFDELNIYTQTRVFYEFLDTLNHRAYMDIANHYYRTEHSDGLLADMWLDGVLSTPSPVMRYAYQTEMTRKRDRLTEMLIATKGNPTSYDTAMRYWTQMSGWFTVDVADDALIQAMKDDGVKRVRWKTEKDNKVCDDCKAYDNVIFDIDELPTKPHPNCRCWIERVS